MAKPPPGSRGYTGGRRAPGWPPEVRAGVGNTRAVTHGAKADLLIAPRAEELRDQLRELVPAYTESDLPALTLLAWQLARCERANAYLDEVGLTNRKGIPRPVLKVLSTWENSAARLCDQLGMTPTARARLGVDHVRGFDLARRLAALDDEEAEGG
jgi:hypothetical protein